MSIWSKIFTTNKSNNYLLICQLNEHVIVKNMIINKKCQKYNVIETHKSYKIMKIKFR
jgi:hypothetical protein